MSHRAIFVAPAPRLPRLHSALAAAALIILSSRSAAAGLPTPPGGHIPVYYGGHNSRAYATTAVQAGQPGSAVVLKLALPQNPARGRTRIEFRAAAGQPARIRIFDVSGAAVRSYLSPAGTAPDRSVTWDGRDAAGRTVSSGLYLVRVECGDAAVSGRLVYLR